jgi:hypothetical protein
VNPAGRLLPILALLPLPAAAPAAEDDPAVHGVYRCTLRPDPAGTLHMSQALSATGRLLETSASWLEPTGFLLLGGRKGAPEPAERGYMDIRVDSRHSPAAADPAWFDMAGAKIQITVVTRRKMRAVTSIVFRRPSRVGPRYEDGLSLLADSSKHVPSTVAAMPYRVFDAFAGTERSLRWQLLRRIGGDAGWAQEAEGHFDLRKVDAFARSAEAARPALAALRADYRNSCQFEPPVQEEVDGL